MALQIRSDVMFSVILSRMRNAQPAVRALWQHHTHPRVSAATVPFSREPAQAESGVGSLVLRMMRRRHGDADADTVTELMRRYIHTPPCARAPCTHARTH